jgi:hypothetical protein
MKNECTANEVKDEDMMMIYIHTNKRQHSACERERNVGKMVDG